VTTGELIGCVAAIVVLGLALGAAGVALLLR
jgi:hypothetical protein